MACRCSHTLPLRRKGQLNFCAAIVSGVNSGLTSFPFQIQEGFANLRSHRLQMWECLAMIALYVAYVVLAIAAHWIERRGRDNLHQESLYRRQSLILGDGDTTGWIDRSYSDDILIDLENASSPAADYSTIAPSQSAPSISSEHQSIDTPLHHLGHYARLLRSPGANQELSTTVRPSLVGAIEFRALASSLRGSRSQSSTSSSTLNRLHIQNADGREPFRSRDSHLPSQRNAPLLRVSSVDGLDVTPSTKSHEQRKRAHSANGAVTRSTSAAQQDAFTSDEPFSVGPNSPLISFHRDVPAIIFTNHETGASSPPDVDRGEIADFQAAHRGVDYFSSSRDASFGRASENGRSTPLVEAFRENRRGSEPIQRNPPARDPYPLEPFPRPSNNPNGRRKSSIMSKSATEPYRDEPEHPGPVPLDSAISGPSGVGDTANERTGLSARTATSSSGPNRYLPTASVLCATMFPTFVYWSRKSTAEKVLAFFTAPSVFMLTLTLPVVDTDEANEAASQEPFMGPSGALRSKSGHPSIDNGSISNDDLAGGSLHKSRPATRSLHTVQDLDNRSTARGGLPLCLSSDPSRTRCDSQYTLGGLPADLAWRHWLSVVQVFTAPCFVAFIVWSNVSASKSFWSLLVWMGCAMAIGLAFFAVFLFGLRTCRDKFCRDFLCLLGFVVSVTWISTIAGEVIGVLKAFGVIFGLSEALLGLTVFALGNRYDPQALRTSWC